jgi:hypothetical protein
MKKVLLLCGIVVAFAFTGVALAALQPGNLNGGGDVPVTQGGTTGSPVTLNITRITMNVGGVTDGQIDPAFYNKNNDQSGTCAGDSGQVNVKYSDSTLASYSVVCAHYSNCRSMSVSYIDTKVDPTGHTYVVFRALNVKPPGKDAMQLGSTTDPNLQLTWVNLGYTTGGARALNYNFPENKILNGNWTLQPNPQGCTPPA